MADSADLLVDGLGLRGGLGRAADVRLALDGCVDAVLSGTHLREHGHERGDGRLVVVGPGGVCAEVLDDRRHRHDDDRKRGYEGDDPDEEAHGGWNEAKYLEERPDCGDAGAREGGALQERLVASEGARVQDVLSRGIVVREDDDRARTLDDLVARRVVDRDDVLAPSRGTEVLEHVPPEVPHGEKDGADQGEQEGDDLGSAVRHAAHQKREEEHKGNDLRHEPAEGMGVELLDRRFEAVVLHHLDDGLGGLELLLAVCGSDTNLVIEIVHVIARLGHIGFPYLEFVGTSLVQRFVAFVS